MNYQAEYQEKLSHVNEALARYIQDINCPATIQKAMEYSLMAGGKRLRPILLLAANQLEEGDPQTAMPLACALEMIHTYSLIHDDLPAMDDDDFRRGRPTNHKVFGEAAAILAGDGLLNLAYEVMLHNVPANSPYLPGYLRAMAVIAAAAGVSGMIGGQVVDIENEGLESSEELLSYIHRHKTGALITAALHAGVLIQTSDDERIKAVTAYGEAIGLAFQITDDILDVTGDIVLLGKSPGSDEKKGKATFPSRFGMDASRKMAAQYIEKAVSALEIYPQKGAFLRQLAASILDRSH